MLAVEARADESDEGPALRFMQSRPTVESWAEEWYVGFYDCDRDGMSGALTFSGMCAVLDEYGITDASERRDVRGIWRSMESARSKKHEELKPEKTDG